MITFLLILVGVACFTIGVAFIFKGYKSIPDPATIVPVKDLEKVKADFDLAKKEVGTLRKQLDTLTKELEEAKSHLQDSQKAKEVLGSLNDESYKGRIQELEMQIKEVTEKAETQAQESLDLVIGLKNEVENLKKVVAAPGGGDQSAKIQAEIESIKAKTQDQAKEAADAIENLLKQNKELQEKNQSAIEQFKQAQVSVEAFNKEKSAFEARLKEETEKFTQLEQKLKESPPVNKETEAQVESLRKTIETLQAENKALAEEKKKEPAPAAPAPVAALAAPDGWMAEKQALEAQIKKLKEYSAFLVDKEKLLQFELTKSRTKAMGLERILEDMKGQVEGFK